MNQLLTTITKMEELKITGIASYDSYLDLIDRKDTQVWAIARILVQGGTWNR